MDMKLFAVVVGAVAVAGWSQYQVHQSQVGVDALSATVQKMKQDVGRNSRSSRTTLNTGSSERIQVADMARQVAREAALAVVKDERTQMLDDSSEALERPPPVTFEESRDLVNIAYDEESTDPDWSSKARTQLDDVLRENLPTESRLVSLECRDTLCRMELIHPDPDTHGSFALDSLEWPGSIFVSEESDQDDQYAVTLYLAREGHEIPLLP